MSKQEKITCPNCGYAISKKLAGKTLGSKGGKHEKNFDKEEKAKRAKRMDKARKFRWPKKK